MTSTTADAECIKQRIFHAYLVAASFAANVPGDLTSLVTRAFHLQFGDDIASIRPSSTKTQLSKESPAELLSVLSDIPPLAPKAQRLLDRVRSILVDGPDLSMNVPLKEGEVLPERLHTLLQGTVFATLLVAGADPRLTGGPPNEPDSRCLWFLCRKFLFSHTVAKKDGVIQDQGKRRFCLYNGRLFHGQPSRRPCQATWVRHHPVVRFAAMGRTLTVATPKGVFQHDDIRRMRGGGWVRVPFPLCPRVARYEAGLGPWAKDRLVLAMHCESGMRVILTHVGLIAAGEESAPLVDFEVRYADDRFRPARLPDGFHPTTMVARESTVLVGQGSRQLVAGFNNFGRLGLGHCDDVRGFVSMPFFVDEIVYSGLFNVYRCGSDHLFAGLVCGDEDGDMSHILTPDAEVEVDDNDNMYITTPTPVRPELAGFFVCPGGLVTVGAETSVCSIAGETIPVPFAVAAVATSGSPFQHVVHLADRSGHGFWVDAGSKQPALVREGLWPCVLPEGWCSMSFVSTTARSE
ncbi:hypothetical protein J8273_1551 [Carpediemonas membranifera]|uniref:Uncharacterized protein n=1 Tax=Carpediemonas membranifera TaxID=201153 RepID=A0A8J6C0G0_9EUKA|nr:hypothetical protein J8273_1551 [Carpediemonas membranifera]|eukprot:KAG9396546.1 hypothetical protein J8273_1551 [Carpediemonas membranifera]